MISISLCMIVKDEELHLGRCLSSVGDLVDEIVIVDTGSSDRTKEIAASFGARIVDFAWIDHFAAARNAAFAQASCDYILWLDADDVLEGDNRAKLQKLKETLDPAVDYVSMPYHLSWDERGQLSSSIRRNRLVKRSRAFRWIGAVHEYLEVYGRDYTSDIAISHRSLAHDSDRNLRIYEQRLAQGEPFLPRDLFYYANELRDHGRYREAIDTYRRFLDQGRGWAEDNINACNRLADCYQSLGETELAAQSSLRSLLYDLPRPEACCRIGYYFFGRQSYDQAIFWYQQALRKDSRQQKWFNFNNACATWLPHLQLCVCYDKIGQHQLAHEHNERALQFSPDDERILSNRRYFQRLLALDE